jgi:predicted esterase
MRRIIPYALVAAAALACAACAKSEAPHVQRVASEAAGGGRLEVVSANVPPADAGLPELAHAQWLERLELSDGDSALVSVPLGTTEPRPVMIAAHGAGDRPEWACGGWRGVTDAFPFIVCPQGTPTKDGRFYWRSTAQLDGLVERAVVALRDRFGAYVSKAPMLYAGFSAGAIYGAAMVREKAAQFPVLMLSEGGYDQLTVPTFAAEFKKNGGHRVLLGCSTGAGCVKKLGEAQRLLEHSGVEARVNDAGWVGHNLNAEVVRSLQKDWPWLVRGQEGWSNFPGSKGSTG